MKNLWFVLLLSFISINIFSQVKWDYPIKPGSEEWKGFTTHQQMVEACKIPDTILEKMSTAELLVAWEKFPLKLDVIAFNTPQQGFEVQKKISSALKLLLTKKDAGEVVLKRYKEAKSSEKEIFTKKHPEISINDYWMLKILLSQPEIRSKINDINDKLFNENELKSKKNLKKAQSSLNIYTPRGTYVPNTVRSDGADDPWDKWPFDVSGTDAYFINTYPQATFLSSSTRTYNCHSYAWADGYTNRCWINSPSDDLYFQNSPGDGSYDYVSESVATKVSYSGDHSATTTGTPDVYISKWGAAPLFQHNKNYVPHTAQVDYGYPSQFHRRSVDVPQDQSSINTAVSTAVSGQTVNVSSGNYTLTDNITVPSGVTLNFNSGATVTFSSGKKLAVCGTLTANGATFQGNGTAGSWHSISYYANSNGSIQYSTIKDAQCGIYTTTNANVTISNNTITNNSLYGLSLIHNSNAPVSNCTISNNGAGINLYSSNVTLTGNNIVNNSNYGINANNIGNSLYWHNNALHGNGYAMLLNNASPWIGHCDISNNAHGVVITSSMTSFAVVPSIDERMRGYNAITCATTPLFKAENYSTVYMGYGYGGGYNSIFGSELPDMEARNHSGIYADNNYWGPYSQPAILADGTSWILARTPLGSDPNPGSCEGFLASSSLTTNSPLVEGNISTKYWEAISNGRGGHFKKAKEILRLIIDGKFNQKYSPLALLSFYEFTLNERNIKNQSGPADSLNYRLNDILMRIYNRAKGDSLRPYAVRLLAREAALSDNSIEMISYNKELVDYYPNSVNELTALYDLVTYYAEIEQNLTKAREFFLRMKEAYPDEDLTKFAGINLGENLGNLKKATLTKTDQTPKVYYLSNAFPNPFNPTTTITYQLPQDGFVTLKVYDMLGREVAVLVDEELTSGSHSVNFNAANLASGTYIYQLNVNGTRITNKMVLLK